MTLTDTPGTRVVTISSFGVVGAAAVTLVAANFLVVTDTYVAFLTPTVGFLAALGVPLFFVYRANLGTWGDSGERLLASVALTLALLLGTGLTLNTLGPHLGIDRPLDQTPVLAVVDLLCVLLAAWSLRRSREGVRLQLGGWQPSNIALGALAMSGTALAAMGATRLNNGAGGGLATFAVATVAATLVVLFVRRERVPEGLVLFVLYTSSLALLFSTSLRGWEATGHDIQHEMSVFLATADAGRWTMVGNDAYRACLSITVLPTMLLRWTGIDEPYIFKVLFQLLYALSPLIVYRLAKRWTSQTTALLCTVYFVGFYGFFQDMPMLARQEIAFLFFGSALLALYRTEATPRVRRVLFGVFALGMVLSHYSTTYFAVAVFAIAWVLQLLHRWLRSRRERRGREGWIGVLDHAPVSGYALTGWLVLFVALGSFMWTGPLTRSGGGLSRSVTNAVRVALGSGEAQRATDTSYAIFRFSNERTPRDTLDRYLEEVAERRATRPEAYYAEAPPTAPLAGSERLPPSWLGRSLDDIGISPSVVNTGFRLGSALGLQVLIAIGLLVALFRRRGPRVADVEAVFLAAAAASLLAMQVVLPSISLDYGLGRSFMQGLIVLGPIVVMGSRHIAIGPFRRRSDGFAAACAIAFFVSSVGLLPQVLGGYGAQLHLNNSGNYYDVYFLHEEEVASMAWLKEHIVEPSSTYPDIQIDKPLVNLSLSQRGLRPSPGIHPVLIRRGSVVLLGYLNLVRGQGDVQAEGVTVRYQLDPAFFDLVKDRIFDAGSARIYQ